MCPRYHTLPVYTYLGTLSWYWYLIFTSLHLHRYLVIMSSKLAMMSCPGANCPLLQQYTCPPNCPRRELACPIRHCLHWAPVSCKPRKRCARPCTVHEPIESFVNRTLSVVWQDLPEPTPTTRATRKLILITTTFPHSLQLLKLQHCVHVLRNVDNIFWVVSEDAAQPSAGVSQLLRASGISHEHIAYGPTRKGGNAQRNQALKLIRRRKMRGVVYNMDDVRTSPVFPALRSVGHT